MMLNIATIQAINTSNVAANFSAKSDVLIIKLTNRESRKIVTLEPTWFCIDVERISRTKKSSKVAPLIGEYPKVVSKSDFLTLKPHEVLLRRIPLTSIFKKIEQGIYIGRLSYNDSYANSVSVSKWNLKSSVGKKLSPKFRLVSDGNSQLSLRFLK
jgi:hypothetical protein